MLLERRRESVKPVLRADEIFQRLARRDVLDADGHNRQALMHGALDLALDLWRRIGVAGKHQHHHPRAVDRADDRLPQPTPAITSRGAIHTRMRFCSSAWQTASAAALSLFE